MPGQQERLERQWVILAVVFVPESLQQFWKTVKNNTGDSNRTAGSKHRQATKQPSRAKAKEERAKKKNSRRRRKRSKRKHTRTHTHTHTHTQPSFDPSAHAKLLTDTVTALPGDAINMMFGVQLGGQVAHPTP